MTIKIERIKTQLKSNRIHIKKMTIFFKDKGKKWQSKCGVRKGEKLNQDHWCTFQYLGKNENLDLSIHNHQWR